MQVCGPRNVSAPIVESARCRRKLVCTIEPNFFGMPMVAFIEDTPSRWFKQPVSEDTEVEVLREG